MSQDPERTKALLALKQRLEKRLGELEEETAEIKMSLEAVNTILLEKGFKRGTLREVETQHKTDPAIKDLSSEGYKGGEPENVIPLKTVNDESLAIIYVENDAVHVLPDESKRFSVNTPPFSNFLVERVLAKMQEKDSELVRLKQLPPEKMFAYNIIREDDLIREIVIKNVDEERLRELKSSIRWTLEKMYEKMKG
ncbi:MAG: hypothetical protein N3D85_01710 [Candidatus Bathyarchaeota archaeon]|nr:hypothetical protein [Candidatus Bathyarchaeota archaeon]